MGGLFILIGVPILLIGLAALLRPAWVRSLLGMPDSEASTYALRIAGMMAAAFGLLLAGFSIAYRLSAPAALTNSQGAL
jgi:hypothetical protein